MNLRQVAEIRRYRFLVPYRTHGVVETGPSRSPRIRRGSLDSDALSATWQASNARSIPSTWGGRERGAAPPVPERPTGRDHPLVGSEVAATSAVGPGEIRRSVAHWLGPTLGDARSRSVNHGVSDPRLRRVSHAASESRRNTLRSSTIQVGDALTAKHLVVKVTRWQLSA